MRISFSTSAKSINQSINQSCVSFNLACLSVYPKPAHTQTRCTGRVGEHCHSLLTYVLLAFLFCNSVIKIFLDPMFFASSTENYGFCFAVVLATTWKQVFYATVEASGPTQFYSFNTYLFRQFFFIISYATFNDLYFFQKCFHFFQIFKLTNTYRKSSFCMLLICTNFTYHSLVI